MINNPEAGIRTNFALDDAVRTSNMNALAQSIQYDYVITDRMLDEMPEAAVTEYGINVDVLLGGGKITQIRTGNVSVLLNIDPQNHPQGQRLPVFYFPCDDVAVTLRVLVYSVHGFSAYIGTPGSNGQARFYFHTGNDADVAITGIGAHTVYVGAFSLAVSSLALPADARFVYELAKGDLPTPSGSGSVKCTMWMTNASAQVQSDWNETDPTKASYIKNKIVLSTFETTGDEDIIAYLNGLCVDKTYGQLLDGINGNVLALLPRPTGSADYGKYLYRNGNTIGYRDLPETAAELKLLTETPITVNSGADAYELYIEDGHCYKLTMNANREVYLTTNSDKTIHTRIAICNYGTSVCGGVTLTWYDEGLAMHSISIDLSQRPNTDVYNFDVSIRKVTSGIAVYAIARVHDYPCAYRVGGSGGYDCADNNLIGLDS